MAFIDKNGRLFGRFNLVNAIIVVVIIAVALVAGVYKLRSVGETGVADTGPVLITVEIADVRQPSVDAVSVGENVVGYESNIPLGPVVEKRVEPHTEPVATSDGRIVMAEVPDHYDLYLDIRGQANIGPNAISLSGRELKIGIELSVSGRLFSFKGVIINVQEVGE